MFQSKGSCSFVFQAFTLLHLASWISSSALGFSQGSHEEAKEILNDVLKVMTEGRENEFLRHGTQNQKNDESPSKSFAMDISLLERIKKHLSCSSESPPHSVETVNLGSAITEGSNSKTTAVVRPPVETTETAADATSILKPAHEPSQDGNASSATSAMIHAASANERAATGLPTANVEVKTGANSAKAAQDATESKAGPETVQLKDVTQHGKVPDDAKSVNWATPIVNGISSAFQTIGLASTIKAVSDGFTSRNTASAPIAVPTAVVHPPSAVPTAVVHPPSAVPTAVVHPPSAVPPPTATSAVFPPTTNTGQVEKLGTRDVKATMDTPNGDWRPRASFPSTNQSPYAASAPPANILGESMSLKPKETTQWPLGKSDYLAEVRHLPSEHPGSVRTLKETKPEQSAWQDIVPPGQLLPPAPASSRSVESTRKNSVAAGPSKKGAANSAMIQKPPHPATNSKRHKTEQKAKRANHTTYRSGGLKLRRSKYKK